MDDSQRLGGKQIREKTKKQNKVKILNVKFHRLIESRNKEYNVKAKNSLQQETRTSEHLWRSWQEKQTTKAKIELTRLQNSLK